MFEIVLPRGAPRLLVLAALMLAPAPALAQQDAPSSQDSSPAETQTSDDDRATITALFENDLFFDADGNYTNGVQAAWTSPALNYDDWLVRAARHLPLFSQGTEIHKSYIIGQNMFTPDDISLKNPPLTERPYAGYLYGGLGLMAKTPGASPAYDRLDQLELQIGMVGPASLARQAQTLVHKLRGFDTPKGWDTQLRNEPGVVLKYERIWRLRTPKLLGFEIQLDPHAGGALGNVYTYANIGAMVRLGFELPDDFGPVRADPSLPGSYYFEPTSSPFGWYIFAGVDGRAMARNIFLDGNSFVHSRSVDKKIFVGDFDFGVAVTIGNVRLTATHVFRTREYKGQKHEDEFGSLSMSYRY
ncbi:MAG TPA: lipid A deacylase LpxR family protein [Rhizomicrobium sp.]|nr:lipid A deacylase LpxR family protein [Rhizomicrobium sp.]